MTRLVRLARLARWEEVRHRVRLLPRRFLEHPFRMCGRVLARLFRWTFHALARLQGRMEGWTLGSLFRLSRRLSVRLTIAVLLLVILGYCATFAWLESRTPGSASVDEYRYLDQGWSGEVANTPERNTFYYTAQGAYLKNVRYDWFTALERPWKEDRFLSSKYMRGYGFIVDPVDVDANPDHLPIGLTRSWDPRTTSMMVDLTCSACHTGELQIVKKGRRVAVRIDGGAAMHEITSTKIGQFGPDLVASLFSTWINPFKWHRFSSRVLRNQPTFGNDVHLWASVGGVIWDMVRQNWSDSSRHLYPVEEGYGRTDALGRIANNVFGTNLDPRNYRVANAPVSYPALWDTWKFDWVQYTASVAQPMARNIGQSLGTGATYSLLDDYGNEVDAQLRYETSTQVANLKVIEDTLQSLKPPPWPEDLFGTIDQTKAMAGKQLFANMCLGCHGPHIATCDVQQIEAPLKDSPLDHWIMTTIPLQEIGTDPTTALNFSRNRFDLRPTGIHADEIRTLIGSYYREKFRRTMRHGTPADISDLNAKTEDEYANSEVSNIDMASVSNGAGLSYIIGLIREEAYKDMDVKEGSYRQRENDGFAQLDIPQELLAYRARPLAGVWATAPYLHNGSVPNLYEMLLPASQRSKTFGLKGRTFDPVKVGLVTDPSDPGRFVFDTTIPGNANMGHEFRAGYVPGKHSEEGPYAYGVIGPELSEAERWQIIEYLKIARDDDFFPPKTANACVPPKRGVEAKDLVRKLNEVFPPTSPATEVLLRGSK